MGGTDISDPIGTTLIRIDGLSVRPDTKIYAKAELMNFSGSVKDRAAYAMISSAVRSGEFTGDKTGERITHFVSGSGTGGTFTGCTRRVNEYNADIKLLLMVPEIP